MEVFRFGLYLFFPVVFMYYVGLPEFYEKSVKGNPLVHSNSSSNIPPLSVSEAREMLEKRLKQLDQSKPTNK